MAETIIKHVYRLKGGEQQAVDYANPFLERREPIVVFMDDGSTKMKIGDGVHNYSELDFLSGKDLDLVGKKTPSGGEIFNDYENNVAEGSYSHAEGYKTLASGESSHAGGLGTIASATGQTAIGMYNAENSDALLIVGNGTSTDGEDINRKNAFEVLRDGSAVLQSSGTSNNSVVRKADLSIINSDIETINATLSTKPGLRYAIKKPDGTTVYGEVFNNCTEAGQNAHSEGNNSKALGSSAHAEGYLTKASSDNSHSEGYSTKALGYGSHAEGDSTTASGSGAHAEGRSTSASGEYSHSEGNNAKASGDASHAEGGSTTASGNQSHAEGIYTTASSQSSHAEGI